MSYFVTGGTGLIGKNLIERLLKRRGVIHVLVRKGSEKKLEALRKRSGVGDDRIKGHRGDLTKPNLGLSAHAIQELKGNVRHFFHLAAVYDITDRDNDRQTQVNVNGTREAVRLAEALSAGVFHHCSSIAVAGMYRGFWREDMFEEADRTRQPYFRTKFEAEAVVRSECGLPYRIYRPGIVVGHSQTGEMDKIDGPYYLFKFLQLLRNILPPWVPLAGIEGGRINVVPVDYVATAMDHIAHKRGLNGKCFHLTSPSPKRVGELLNIFAKAANAPQFAMRIDARMLDIIPRPMRDMIANLPPVERIVDGILKDLGIPREVWTYVNYPTRFDAREAEAALEGSGITCPAVEDYAPALWDYWERNLDPDLRRDHTLPGAVRGKVVVITGASSGIGKAVALRAGAAGARTILVARDEERLAETKREIEGAGGVAYAYSADLAEGDQCAKLLARIFHDHDHVDILVNNAGKSIRRSVHHSYDRFHDYQRCIELNYFGSVRLILGVLPKMEENGFGHIVNVSSIGVLANVPRFSAYIASKSALDAFTRCARPEYLDRNIHFTTINMPLVQTPMIGPTKMYEHVPKLTADEAGDMVCRAFIDRPKRIATRLGIFSQMLTTIAPQITDVVLNTAYKLFHDSSAATGQPRDEQPTAEAVAFASLMRGVHW